MEHAKWAVLPDVDMARRQLPIRLAGAERSARLRRHCLGCVRTHEPENMASCFHTGSTSTVGESVRICMCAT
eukprot:5776368-Pleurochrysis_carterae.AAC.1